MAADLFGVCTCSTYVRVLGERSGAMINNTTRVCVLQRSYTWPIMNEQSNKTHILMEEM